LLSYTFYNIAQNPIQYYKKLISIR